MAPEAGRLYVCSTPIGNQSDITLRALDVLRSVSCIAAEDTRETRKLLDFHGIKTPLTSLHEHNEASKSAVLVRRMQAGEALALVSDAGTPVVSDPGLLLVRAALEAGITVVPVPGASALLAALVASGLPAHPHYFGGFLPRKSSERLAVFESLRALSATLVFYEVPHRLRSSLRDLASAFPERRTVVARELTKLYEEFVRGTPEELCEHFTATEPRGECVILVEGITPKEQQIEVSDAAVEAALMASIDAGKSKKEAIKDVASFLGLSKNAVYRVAISLTAKEGER